MVALHLDGSPPQRKEGPSPHRTSAVLLQRRGRFVSAPVVSQAISIKACRISARYKAVLRQAMLRLWSTLSRSTDIYVHRLVLAILQLIRCIYAKNLGGTILTSVEVRTPSNCWVLIEVSGFESGTTILSTPAKLCTAGAK